MASSLFAVLVNIGCRNKTCSCVAGSVVVQLFGRGGHGGTCEHHLGRKGFLRGWHSRGGTAPEAAVPALQAPGLCGWARSRGQGLPGPPGRGKGRGVPARGSLQCTAVIGVSGSAQIMGRSGSAHIMGHTCQLSTPEPGPAQSCSVQPKCIWVTMAARVTRG